MLANVTIESSHDDKVTGPVSGSDGAHRSPVSSKSLHIVSEGRGVQHEDSAGRSFRTLKPKKRFWTQENLQLAACYWSLGSAGWVRKGLSGAVETNSFSAMSERCECGTTVALHPNLLHCASSE